jgi:hypothetical protein
VGAAKVALVAVALVARSAHGESCTGISKRGDRFATCFDLGNRLSVTAGSGGVGLAVAVRHEITFDDDPDLEWKMEHVMVEGEHAALDGGFTAAVYRGRYMRHARDGHIVIPLGTPKKVFLPFDIGAIAEVGRVEWHPMDPNLTLGVVRTAPLIDFARDLRYRRLFAIGPVAHWDMEVDRDFKAISQHIVAPFTEGMADVHLESATGLYAAEFRVEAGTAWRSDLGWRPEARASAEIERIVLAVNDRPIALMAGVRYDSVRAETIAGVGVRFVLIHRTDPRVSLHPLKVDRTSVPVPVPVAPPEPAPVPNTDVPDPTPNTDVPDPAPDPTPDPALAVAREDRVSSGLLARSISRGAALAFGR